VRTRPQSLWPRRDLFSDYRKTQQAWLGISVKLCFDLYFFSTFGKYSFHGHVSFSFAKSKKCIKPFCTKLVVLQARIQVLRFGWQNTFVEGKDFSFYYTFKTNLTALTDGCYWQNQVGTQCTICQVPLYGFNCRITILTPQAIAFRNVAPGSPYVHHEKIAQRRRSRAI